MKKKTIRRSLSLLCSLALMFSLAIPAFAGEINSGEAEWGAGGVTYKYYSTLYDESTKWAGTWVYTDGYVNVPNNTMAAQARLYGADGNILRTSDYITNYGSSYFTYAITDEVNRELTVYSWGQVRLPDGNGSFVTKLVPKTQARSVDSCDILIAKLEENLDSNGEYPVNAAGQTYGSGLLFSVVGYEPDLLAAEGVGGVQGYIKTADIEADSAVLRADPMIPLYDLNGNVVGSFKVSVMDEEPSPEVLETIRELEAAKAAQK